MIELLITIFTGGGAVGLGSIFKMVAGFVDSRNQAKELREHRKILKETKDSESALAFQKEVFGDTKVGMFARCTRRMLALIGVSTLAIGTLHCTLFPADPFITLGSVATGGEGTKPIWSALWGFLEIHGSDKPIYLTLGHVALMNFIGFQMILGYYFTPGGRK